MRTTLTTNKTPAASDTPLALASTVVLAMAAWPATVSAADWQVLPSVTARATYTDNVRLAPSGSAENDFIAELTPAITVSTSSRRFKFTGQYALQYLSYADDPQGSSTNHQLGAYATAELVENLFFIDGSASSSQQNISAGGAQPIDNTSVTGNRTTVKTYTISPYLRHSFGSTADGTARYTHSGTDTNSGVLSSASIDSALLGLDSGAAFRTLGWGLQYLRTRNHFNDEERVSNQSVDSSTTTATLRYLMTPQFSLIGTGGYDKYDYVSTTGDDPKGTFYTAGFSWRPTERTRVAASAGHRFYGRTYSLESSVRSRQTVWSINYTEGITTTQQQFAIQATSNTAEFLNQLFQSSIPDPVARQRAVERFILSTGLPPSLARSTNYFSNQFYLQKGLQASVAANGVKNTVVVTLFDTKRESQTALSASDALLGFSSQSLDANTRQRGIDALWNWRITGLTSATFNAGYGRTHQVTSDDTQRQKILRAVLSSRLQPRLTGSLELRHQSLSTDLPGGDYTENAFVAALIMQF